MDKRISYLYRHLSNREIREMTGIPTRRVRAIREGDAEFTAKEYRHTLNKYASIQYHRLREAGINKRDAQNFKKNNPGFVREVITKNLHYGRIIAKSEIRRIKESNIDRIERGEDRLDVPTFEEKFYSVLEGMGESKTDFDDRWEWEDYGQTND